MTNWNTILTFTYPHEAHPVKALLDSHNIPTFLKDELTVQAHNFYSNAVGRVKLQVPENEFEKAYALLKEAGFIKEKPDNNTIEKVSQDENTNLSKCHFCGSENISLATKGSIITYLLLLVSIFLPIFKRYNQCYDCGKKWKYTKK